MCLLYLDDTGMLRLFRKLFPDIEKTRKKAQVSLLVLERVLKRDSFSGVDLLVQVIYLLNRTKEKRVVYKAYV
jgi:hypothetical protein